MCRRKWCFAYGHIINVTFLGFNKSVYLNEKRRAHLNPQLLRVKRRSLLLREPLNLKLPLSHLYWLVAETQEIRRLWRNLEDWKRSPSRRHLIPISWLTQSGKIATRTVEISVEATLITSAALGRDDPVCTTFFPVRMTQQQKIFMKLGYNFFTVLTAWTNSPSTLKFIQLLKG